jgi:fusion and transport protein UGO1
MGTLPNGPNPLRPYYIPPSIGSPASRSHIPAAATSGPSGAKTGFGSSARDILSDLDYSDYLGDSSPSISELIKDLLDKGFWKYCNVLMAQPLEVAKTILQVYIPQDVQEGRPETDERRRRSQGFREHHLEDVGFRDLDVQL